MANQSFNLDGYQRPALEAPDQADRAPCAGEVMLAIQTSGIEQTVFFYKPNIHPVEEYKIIRLSGRFIMWFLLSTLFLSFSIFGNTLEECKRSVETVDSFFVNTDFAKHIINNDVFAVLGRTQSMEINFVEDFESSTITHIPIQKLDISITYARDKKLTPDLKNIINSKFFLGQIYPMFYCSDNIKGLEICCIYKETRSKRHTVSEDEEQIPLTKKSAYKSRSFDEPVLMLSDSDYTDFYF